MRGIITINGRRGLERKITVSLVEGRYNGGMSYAKTFCILPPPAKGVYGIAPYKYS
jgi:hypothetical protein